MQMNLDKKRLGFEYKKRRSEARKKFSPDLDDLTYEKMNKEIFMMMAINLNSLTRLQQNYVQAQTFHRDRKNKMKKIENLLLELKEQILKNLLHNARCGKFEYYCEYLNIKENLNKDDTKSHARFVARYHRVLIHYRRNLFDSLRLIYYFIHNHDLSADITNNC
ncbi:hypothetical protein NH340_JMT05939 [Sarcoptes scabiei]|nr:hypothetical protein NH340_JMT05939 [Sarcoptes scabiei]